MFLKDTNAHLIFKHHLHERDEALSLAKEWGVNEVVFKTAQLEAFDKAGIEVVFHDPVLPKVHPQCFPKAGFVGSLSALDLMLNCGESWRDYFPANGSYEG